MLSTRDRVRVLLVEDDEDDRLLVADMLGSIRGVRFELRWARTVADGLAELSAGPDVCLLDHRLGAQTGADFLAAARGTPVPIVVLTGDDDPATDAAAIAAGAADYLLKRRLDPWVLERTLLRAILRSEALADRLRAEAALRGSRDHYRRIVESATEGVWVVDAEARTTFMNARMAAMLGYTAEAVVGRPVSDFVDADDGPAGAAQAGGRRAGVAEEHELRFRRRDGSVFWASSRSNPLFDADGRYEGAVAIVADVTERRRADELRARLAAIVEASDDAIISTDLRGAITSWNPGAARLFGYPAPEALGRGVAALVPPDRRDAFELALARAARGERADPAETKGVRADGSTVEVLLKVSPIRESGGRVTGAAVIASDLTEARRIERALRRAEAERWQGQKLEAIGRLAGGVAHDFNNLLSVILGYTATIRDALEPGSPLRPDVDEVYRAGERAAELTAQLLAFSRQQVIQPRVIDINASLRGMERMLRRVVGEHIELALRAAPALGTVRADPGQIEQVIMNLVVNARDAMPGGGRLTLETADVDLDEAYAASHPGTTPGPHVMLAVSDTGGGMDAPTRSRVFEPFFTTKARGKGTGLGLATVFGVVHQSGGTILVYSEPGHGTTFKVYLPRLDAPPTEAPAERRDDGRGRRGGTVLLVEDEGPVRAIVRAALQRDGYTVLEASNGAEALEVAAGHAGEIQLLLTDVVMPRMSGPELAARLAPARAEMKVLFMSGYAEGSIVHHGVLDARTAFLPKPITPAALLRKVRDVLEAP